MQQMLTLTVEPPNALRLLSCDDACLETIKGCIKSSWINGIKTQSAVGDFIRFELEEDPWTATKNRATEARQLIANIIRDLQAIGWQLSKIAKLDSSMNDSLIFKQSTKRADSLLSYIQLEGTKVMAFANFPEEFIEFIKKIFKVSWRGVTPFHSVKYGTQRFEFDSIIWNSRGRIKQACIRILGNILDFLDKRGWIFIQGLQFSKDSLVDTLYFQYDYLRDSSVHNHGENRRFSPNSPDIAAVYLEDGSRLNIVNFPPEFVEITRNLIQKIEPDMGFTERLAMYSSRSIVNPLDGCAYKYVLDNSTFSYTDETNFHKSRQLIMMLLCEFKSLGWCLYSVMKVSNDEGQDFDVLYFQKTFSMPDDQVCSLVVRGNDSVSLIGLQDPECDKLINTLKSINNGGYVMKTSKTDHTFSLTFDEPLFNAVSATESIKATKLLIDILSSMDRIGWVLLESMQIATADQNGLKYDTLIFEFDVDFMLRRALPVTLEE